MSGTGTEYRTDLMTCLSRVGGGEAVCGASASI